jgi:hypothetical protein
MVAKMTIKFNPLAKNEYHKARRAEKAKVTEESVIERACKAAGLSYTKGGAFGVIGVSPARRAQALEAYISDLQGLRDGLAEYGQDAHDALARVNSEISQALEALAVLKINELKPA